MDLDLNNRMEQTFGAMDLTEDHCKLFYYLTIGIVIVACFMVSQLLYSFFIMFQSKERSPWMVFIALLILLIAAGVYSFLYYFYRILYSMCIRSANKKTQ